MKILLLCNKSPWPPKDGGSAATLCMIKGLSESKVFVTVLAFNTTKHFTDAREIPEEFRNNVEYHLVYIDTRVNLVKLIKNLFFSKKPYNYERFESDDFEETLSELLRKNFDVIQIEGLALCQYLPVIRRESTAKIVFRPHNVECRIWSQLSDEETNPFIKFYFRLLSERIKREEVLITNQVDALVAITPNDLSWFKSNGLSKPAIVAPPGTEIKYLNEISALSNSTVFYIGALDWLPNIKGIRWFINEVWPLVSKVASDASLNIAGRNASDKTVKFMKGENLFFHGEVPSSSAFMNDKQIMVIPLFSGSGIRMRIIEGMSLGKCIVTTSRGAEGIKYEDRKNIFIADTADDFAGCIIDLLKNADLQKRTAEKAIENIRENYNILATTEKLLKFYGELTA